MTKSKIVIIPALIFLLISLFVLIGCEEQVEITGEKFTFTEIDGTNRQLSEFYGKILVLDFMAVDCYPYCYNQMFELKKIAENYSREDVEIISIDVWVTQGETAEYLQSYIDYFKVNLNIDLDWTFGLDDSQGTLQKKYASQGVPTLLILRRCLALWVF